MKKISLYYLVLLAVIGVQFVMSVVGKSMAVQQSVSLVTYQKELAVLEKRESELVNLIAARTALIDSPVTNEFVAITKPVALQPKSLVAVGY